MAGELSAVWLAWRLWRADVAKRRAHEGRHRAGVRADATAELPRLDAAGQPVEPAYAGSESV